MKLFNMAQKTNLLVLCLLISVFAPHSVAESNDTTLSPLITFDQNDGMLGDSFLNLSGNSNVPLTSVEISIWNISMPDQWTLITSSPYMDLVVPFTSAESDSTAWSWAHSFDTTELECTCYVEVSLMEGTDQVAFGLVAYIGEYSHRPVLRPVESSDIYSMQIFNGESVSLSYEVLLPANQDPSSQGNTIIIPNVRLCPAPYGICTEDYSVLSVSSDFSERLELDINTTENSILDGYYLLQIQIQDDLLVQSNNLTQYVLFDQTKPSVQLTAIEEVTESEPIVVDISVEDGYIGSSYVITWSITEPDGSPRPVLPSEILEDSRLEFIPVKSGYYQVNALVRDTGGFLVYVNHNVNVTNLQPTASVRYDGFLILDGSTVTVRSYSNWEFSANSSTDSANDVDGLEYFWYVDGKSLLSGKSYLSPSDLQSSSFSEIRVEVVDDDGHSSNLSFAVTQQTDASNTSSGNTTLPSLLVLFSILFIGILMIFRRKVNDDTNTQFVKWSERSEKPKN